MKPNIILFHRPGEAWWTARITDPDNWSLCQHLLPEFTGTVEELDWDRFTALADAHGWGVIVHEGKS